LTEKIISVINKETILEKDNLNHKMKINTIHNIIIIIRATGINLPLLPVILTNRGGLPGLIM